MRYIFLVFISLFLQSCKERIEGQKPVDYFDIRTKYITVQLDKGYNMDSVCQRELFQNLRPGINSRTAKEKLGANGHYVHVSKYLHYDEFMVDNGRLRIMEEYSFEDGISNWLELIPYEVNIDKLVIQQIAREIDISDKNLENVYVYTFDKNEFLTFTMADGQIKSIAWLTR